MHRTLVICAVGLTPRLITSNTPRLKQLADGGRLATIEPVVPAVTCSVQSTYLTGTWPDDHGIVGNGWYVRDECEIRFWRQSNKLVQRPKVWERQREINAGGFTVANLFWWFNMYSSADIAVTPRPMYPADGRKLPDIWTTPPSLRDELQRELGPFPLFKFWGPAAGIESTRWIVDAALLVAQRFDPTLTLVYLPHLDYDLQRFGPDSAEARRAAAELDGEIGRLLDQYVPSGHRIMLLSEYGIGPVSRPVHLNRELRKQGMIATRDELGRELLDAGLSDAFAVADHQVAHVYVNNPIRRQEVRRAIENTPGVARVYDGAHRAEIHLDHERAGDLVVLAEPDAWFTYYYWLDDARAPDFARMVEIHRKPGYDPAELLIDPAISHPKLAIGWRLAKRKAGFRTLLDVIGLDASIVRGSHGIPPRDAADGAVLLTSQRNLLSSEKVAPTKVQELILAHLNG